MLGYKQFESFRISIKVMHRPTSAMISYIVLARDLFVLLTAFVIACCIFVEEYLMANHIRTDLDLDALQITDPESVVFKKIPATVAEQTVHGQDSTNSAGGMTPENGTENVETFDGILWRDFDPPKEIYLLPSGEAVPPEIRHIIETSRDESGRRLQQQSEGPSNEAQLDPARPTSSTYSQASGTDDSARGHSESTQRNDTLEDQQHLRPDSVLTGASTGSRPASISKASPRTSQFSDIIRSTNPVIGEIPYPSLGIHEAISKAFTKKFKKHKKTESDDTAPAVKKSLVSRLRKEDRLTG